MLPASFRDGFQVSANGVYRALATESVLKCNAYSYANRPQTKKSDIGLHTRWRSGRRMGRTVGGKPWSSGSSDSIAVICFRRHAIYLSHMPINQQIAF